MLLHLVWRVRCLCDELCGPLPIHRKSQGNVWHLHRLTKWVRTKVLTPDYAVAMVFTTFKEVLIGRPCNCTLFFMCTNCHWITNLYAFGKAKVRLNHLWSNLAALCDLLILGTWPLGDTATPPGDLVSWWPDDLATCRPNLRHLEVTGGHSG